MSKRYKSYLPEDLLSAYTRNADDPEKLDLSDELGILRILLGKKIESTFLEEDIDDKSIKSVTTLIDKIAKVQTSISDHETKQNNYIHVRTLPVMLEAIGRIIKSVVGDEKLVELISDKIKSLPLMTKTVDVEVLEEDGE